MRIPSLRLLSGFEAAARLGNFSRAADELHLSQSSISHQILQLEEQVGMKLFRRKGRGVELTIAGEILHRSVVRSLETIKSGLGRIETYQNPSIVTIVCPAPLLHGWLNPQVMQMQAAIPGLLPVLSADVAVRYIDQDDIDITISASPLPQHGLLSIPFLNDEWVVVASRQIAAQLAHIDCTQHHQHVGLICLEQSLTNEVVAPIFRGQLADFKKRALYDDVRVLLDSAIRGYGIACLPRLIATDSLERGELVILPNYQRCPDTTWWLSRTDQQPRSAMVVEVFNWLLSHAQKQP